MPTLIGMDPHEPLPIRFPHGDREAELLQPEARPEILRHSQLLQILERVARQRGRRDALGVSPVQQTIFNCHDLFPPTVRLCGRLFEIWSHRRDDFRHLRVTVCHRYLWSPTYYNCAAWILCTRFKERLLIAMWA